MAYLIFAGFLSFAIGIFWMLANNAGRIHDKIDDFHNQAKKASSLNELRNIQEELIAYALKECWHKKLTSHVREVLFFIKGKINKAA